MKALTISQPWASLIMQGMKTIEVRGWMRMLEGLEFYIHAGKNPDHDICNLYHLRGDVMPCGVIIAKATISEVIEYNHVEEFLADQSKHLIPLDRWKGRCFGYVLKDVERVPFMKARGQLGFWEFTKKGGCTVGVKETENLRE